MLDKIQGIAYELTLDEMDALIDALDNVYVDFKVIVDARNGVKPE